MITDNCKFYYQSEKGELIPVDYVQSLSSSATYGVDANSSLDTSVTLSIQAEFSLNEWCFIQGIFLTKLEKQRQFNEQCRRDLHRWFRENEPFINDLADDISAANRTKFKIFKNGR